MISPKTKSSSTQPCSCKSLSSHHVCATFPGLDELYRMTHLPPQRRRVRDHGVGARGADQLPAAAPARVQPAEGRDPRRVRRRGRHQPGGRREAAVPERVHRGGHARIPAGPDRVPAADPGRRGRHRRRGAAGRRESPLLSPPYIPTGMRPFLLGVLYTRIHNAWAKNRSLTAAARPPCRRARGAPTTARTTSRARTSSSRSAGSRAPRVTSTGRTTSWPTGRSPWGRAAASGRSKLPDPSIHIYIHTYTHINMHTPLCTSSTFTPLYR